MTSELESTVYVNMDFVGWWTWLSKITFFLQVTSSCCSWRFLKAWGELRGKQGDANWNCETYNITYQTYCNDLYHLISTFVTACGESKRTILLQPKEYTAANTRMRRKLEEGVKDWKLGSKVRHENILTALYGSWWLASIFIRPDQSVLLSACWQSLPCLDH